MFSCDLNLDHVDAKPERVVSLIRSLNKIDLIPQDGGDGEPEPTEAFIAGVQRAQDQYDIVAYLYHERTHTPRVYVWGDGEVTRANFADVETQALDFIESMGFMMDNTQFRKQSPEQRQELFESVPIFFSGGGKYREMLESKVDPSLLDLSDDLVDLEENPDAFEEEKKVQTAVDVDAYETRGEEKKKSVFDELEKENPDGGAEEAKNPFDDFDSGAGSEFDSSAFDDVAPPPAKGAKSPAKAGKPAAATAATDSAGGSVSELVEHPDEEAGALDALSEDLDSALADDGMEAAEAVEIEDLPETEEIENAEDVEDIAEITSEPPAPVVAEDEPIEIAFDEPVPPAPQATAAKAAAPKKAPPAKPVAAPAAASAAVPAEESVDFGEIGDDSMATGGGADFGEFLEDGKKAKKGADEDDFAAIASGSSAGDLTSDMDEFMGGEKTEETPASAEDLFGDGGDLAADLDKSLDDILSGPPAPKAAVLAGEPEMSDEVIEDDDIGLQALSEPPASAKAPEKAGKAPAQPPAAPPPAPEAEGLEIDFSADDPLAALDVPAPAAPPPAASVAATVTAAVPAAPVVSPVQAEPPVVAAAAVPQLSAEERAARLGIYGKLFATL